MITYVNTVLVTNKNNQALATKTDLQEKTTKAEAVAKAGAIVINDIDVADGYTLSADTKRFKIGVITSDATQVRHKDGSIKYIPIVKWSNVINVNDIKSIKKVDYKDDVEDKVVVDFTNLDETTASLFAEGGCTITLRITYKDMPTRYRKWTESYSYVTKPGDTKKDIIDGLFNDIMIAPKRQRINVTKTATTITLEAMKYDDDEQAVTENVYAKVRFDANMYYSNSKAPGWASNNKYKVAGVTIKKTEGTTNASSAKLVRDRERAAFDYSGVLHRCCWFDPQPKMVTDINAQYNGITIEFENMYRTADDLHRKTKQTVELYITNNGTADTTAQAAVLAQLQTVSNAISAEADQIAHTVGD